MRSKLLLLSLVSMAVVHTGAGCTAQGSPWGQPSGDLFFSQRHESYRADGGAQAFDQQTYQLYGEYGLSNRLTVGAKATYANQNLARQGQPTGTWSGLVEQEAFVQAKLFERGAHTFSAQLLHAPETKLRSTATGDFDSGRAAATQVSMQYGHSRQKGFSSTTIGYRQSHGQDADQFRFEARAGHYLGRRTLLLAEFTLQSATGQSGLDGARFDLGTFSQSIVLPVAKTVDLQLGGRWDVTGNNLDLGRGGFIALWVRR